MAIVTIGLDLAKLFFQVHCIDEVGKAVVRRQLRRAEVETFFSEAASLSGRHGGLWFGASLGAAAGGDGGAAAGSEGTAGGGGFFA